MKVQSKKQFPYIVETNDNEERVRIVGQFVSPMSGISSQWSYFVCYDHEEYDIEDKLNKAQLMLPIIQFEEWLSLPDVPKPEYDPKDVAFKPIGYKFKDENIRNIVTAFLGSIEAYKTDSYDFPVKSLVYRELKELQVLDLWCDKVLFEKESEFNSSNAFKELKKETDKLLKIVGYKLIKPEYKEAAKIIALSHVGEKIKYYKGNIETIGIKNGASCKKALEEAGVLSLWFEPIYDTSITLKSGVKLSEDDIAEVKEILKNK